MVDTVTPNFPFDFAPYFYIETCSQCNKHQSMFNHHNGEKYINMAEQLKAKILGLIPELSSSRHGVERVLINEYLTTMSDQDSRHDQEIMQRIRKGKYQVTPDNIIYSDYPTKRYGLEVYFMGVRVFSKVASRLWPNTSAVAMKCVRAFNDFHEGNQIGQYEYMTKKQRERMEQGNISD